MSLFAIGDLHLPGGAEKPMSVFGPQWDRHFFRISESWREQVREEDTVLIPGDISWAMKLEDAVPDLLEIGMLPGTKILIRGNHDYWWNGITRVRAALPPRMFALQQDALETEHFIVCGTRGWTIPAEDAPMSEEDGRIYARELQRLSMALEAAERKNPEKPVAVMLHFPPLYQGTRRSGFTELMEQHSVKLCVYGHLHGSGIAAGFSGEQGGVKYQLVSCDSQDFQVRKINFL